MTSAKGRPGRSPLANLRTRFRLLEIGLLLPMAVTAVVGVAYVKAVRARQEAVDAAARQIARRVVDQVIIEATRIGDAAAQTLLLPLQQLRPRTPQAVLSAMQAATDSLRACRCGPLKEGAFFFWWLPSTGQVVTSVPLPPNVDLAARLAPVHGPPPGSRATIWAMGGKDEAGPWLLHLTDLDLGGGRVAIAGHDISMASWWNGTFLPAIRSTRTAFFPMLADPDTAFAAYLVAGPAEVARDGPRYDGAGAEVGTISGTPFRFGITLNAAILPVLVASTVPPSYPLLLGAFAASVLVSLMALLLLRQVRRTMAQREAFVASISHELRTPLTEMLLHAESLQLDRPTPEAKGRAAGSIVRETRRLIGLVENTLTMAGAGRPGDPPGPVQAAPVVRETLRFLEPAAAARGATLAAELDEAAVCLSDPVALDRIVTNLVENAVRYGPAGQTIRIGLHRAPGEVRLAVCDQGPGVPAGERARIWVPFERGSAARGTAAAGVGLGLAIVRHLAERSGGSVAVGDAPGGGACFTVNLPDGGRHM